MRAVFLFTIIAICIKGLQAQDANFSQFYAASSYYNPAFAGAFDGKYRVRLVNRSQWVGEDVKSLRTFGILGDLKFSLKSLDLARDYFGLGIYFISDRARALDFTSNEAAVTVSYHKILDKKKVNYISGGLSLGIIQRGLNYDQFVFEDQFDGVDQYNGNTKEILPPNISAKPDLKLGVQWNTQMNAKYRLQTGLSTHYTLRPQLSYYKALDDVDYIGEKKSLAFVKLNFIANLTYSISSLRQLYPRLLYSYQGPHQLAVFGANYRHGFYSLKQTAVHAGAAIRVAKSKNLYTPVDLVLQSGFEMKNFILGLSYDFGLRNVISYGRPSHSFEISITLLGDYDDGGFICPEF
ncbi:MAG: PorP/SprF family type IX secretion system membrane protein [Saprospiraceae bacterium]|nr:PorP/SprF family type IX secretion system membrane protein [Saprospiraceae bacterium]